MATELLIGALGLPASSSNTITEGPGYTIEEEDTAVPGSRSAAEDQIVTSQGTFSAVFTLSSGASWSAAVATFSTTPSNTAAPISITTTSLPNGTTGASYNATLGATGGTPPYNWTESGSLPPGLTLSANGTLSGRPTAAGTWNFLAQVTDTNSGGATQSFSITVTTSTPNPISLVQSKGGWASGVTSISQAFASPNTQGNLAVAFVRMSTTAQTVTVTDSAGNIYSDAIAQAQLNDGHQTHIFYAKNIKSGANAVAATFSGTNNHPYLAIYEFSGLSTTAPLDQVAGAQGSSSAASALTSTTTAARELVLAGLGLPSSSSVSVMSGNGFALLQQDSSSGRSRSATEDKFVSATGQYAGTFSTSGAANWSVVVATFKQ